MQDQDYVHLVDTFLQTFERRDLDAAQAMMTARPKLVFPPGREFDSLTALSEGLKRNYRWVKKHRDSYAVGRDVDSGHTTVVSRGRLYGEDLDGNPFEDIHYIDFFVIEDGKIAEQHVWNHLAAAGIVKV